LVAMPAPAVVEEEEEEEEQGVVGVEY
jgi:hypothetical protein